MKKARGKSMKALTREAGTGRVAADKAASSGQKRHYPSERRRGSVTPADLTALIGFMNSQSGELKAIIDRMQKLAIVQLDDVDGVTQMARGKDLIARFTANVYKAMSKETSK